MDDAFSRELVMQELLSKRSIFFLNSILPVSNQEQNFRMQNNSDGNTESVKY